MADIGITPSPRVGTLIALGRALCEGSIEPETVRQAQPEIREATAEDTAFVVDALVAEGISLDKLRGGVSRLLNLLNKTLAGRSFEPDDPFFGSLVEENKAILAAADRLRRPLADYNEARGKADESAISKALELLVAGLEGLRPIEVHYVKKEHILFPWFEARYPRWRCLNLMWAIHDDVRGELAALPRLLQASDLKEINAAFGRLFFGVHALVFREERILFPLVASLLSSAERFGLWRESKSLGFCLLDAGTLARLEASAATHGSDALAETGVPGGAIPLDAGSLPREVLDTILKTLPVDLTFVDAADRVAWFSNGGHRIFPRSPSIIGRDVRNCHPAASVGKVLDLLEGFRKGERDVEDFWIETKGRFVLIRYTAIRGPRGEYLGTLECSQDLTDARALTGEKRLAGPR